MAKMQRTKGKTAQRECRYLLQENDWGVIDVLQNEDADDLVVTTPSNTTTYSCEVKHHKIINLGAFVKQAREQSKKRKLPWMLCCQLPGYPKSWLVLRENKQPEIWQKRETNESRIVPHNKAPGAKMRRAAEDI